MYIVIPLLFIYFFYNFSFLFKHLTTQIALLNMALGNPNLLIDSMLRDFQILLSSAGVALNCCCLCLIMKYLWKLGCSSMAQFR